MLFGFIPTINFLIAKIFVPMQLFYYLFDLDFRKNLLEWARSSTSSTADIYADGYWAEKAGDLCHEAPWHSIGVPFLKYFFDN